MIFARHHLPSRRCRLLLPVMVFSLLGGLLPPAPCHAAAGNPVAANKSNARTKSPKLSRLFGRKVPKKPQDQADFDSVLAETASGSGRSATYERIVKDARRTHDAFFANGRVQDYAAGKYAGERLTALQLKLARNFDGLVRQRGGPVRLAREILAGRRSGRSNPALENQLTFTLENCNLNSSVHRRAAETLVRMQRSTQGGGEALLDNLVDAQGHVDSRMIQHLRVAAEAAPQDPEYTQYSRQLFEQARLIERAAGFRENFGVRLREAGDTRTPSLVAARNINGLPAVERAAIEKRYLEIYRGLPAGNRMRNHAAAVLNNLGVNLNASPRRPAAAAALRPHALGDLIRQAGAQPGRNQARVTPAVGVSAGVAVAAPGQPLPGGNPPSRRPVVANPSDLFLISFTPIAAPPEPVPNE